MGEEFYACDALYFAYRLNAFLVVKVLVGVRADEADALGLSFQTYHDLEECLGNHYMVAADGLMVVAFEYRTAHDEDTSISLCPVAASHFH